MLTGHELGNALAQAIKRKGVSKTEVAVHFGVKPPSVHDWIKHGRIGKQHLTELLHYFSDVVGPVHWGLDANITTTPPNSLTPDEIAMLDLWRGLGPDGKRSVQAVAHALAQPQVKRGKAKG